MTRVLKTLAICISCFLLLTPSLFYVSFAHADKSPRISVSILLDKSGSMGDKGNLDRAKAAFFEIVKFLRDDDSVALIAFDTSPWLLYKGKKPSEICARWRPMYERLHPALKGNTDYGLQQAVHELTREANVSRYLIVLTDGGKLDNTSLSIWAKAMRNEQISARWLLFEGSRPIAANQDDLERLGFQVRAVSSTRSALAEMTAFLGRETIQQNPCDGGPDIPKITPVAPRAPAPKTNSEMLPLRIDCRAFDTPSKNGKVVANLVRGDLLEILIRHGPWMVIRGKHKPDAYVRRECF